MIHRLTVQFLAKGSYAVEVIHPSYCAAAKSNSFVGLCFQPCMNSQLAGTSKNLECQRFSILITLNCTDFWAFKCPCRTVGFQIAHTFEAALRDLWFSYIFSLLLLTGHTSDLLQRLLSRTILSGEEAWTKNNDHIAWIMLVLLDPWEWHRFLAGIYWMSRDLCCLQCSK